MLNRNTLFQAGNKPGAGVGVEIGQCLVVAGPKGAHAGIVAGAPAGVFLAYGQFKRAEGRVAVNSPAVGPAELVPSAARLDRIGWRCAIDQDNGRGWRDSLDNGRDSLEDCREQIQLEGVGVLAAHGQFASRSTRPASSMAAVWV